MTPLRKRGESHRRLTSLGVEQRGLLFDAERSHGLDRTLDAGVFGLAGRDLEHAALAEPDVLAVALAERAHRRHDAGRSVCELQRGTVSQHASERRQRRPVAMQEPSVPAARPVADLACLEQRHGERGVALAQREGRPEPRVPTADDRDVHVDRPVERRRYLCASVDSRLLEPPRRP